MKKIISIILCISILISVPATSFAETLSGKNLRGEIAKLYEEDETAKEEREQLELKYDMFKVQQNVSTFSNDDKVVYDGTFEEYNQYYQSIKETGNTNRGPAFGGTKKREDAQSEETAENSIETFALNTPNTTNFNALVRPAFLNGINHPHLSGRSADEYVSTFDGTLTLNFTDITLPGKNGLDLNLGRYYKSEQGFVDLYTAHEFYYAEPTTYLNKRFALGLGWGLSFPSVEVHKDSNGDIQATYHDGTGASYRSNYGDISRDDGDFEASGYYIYNSNLDNYPSDNVRFKEKDRGYSRNGMRSYFSFTDENNTKQYFTETGEIIAIVDQYGNEITFDYEYVRGENLIPFYSLNGNTNGEFDYGVGFSSDGNNIAVFNGGENGKEGTLESYEVELDLNYDQYYANLVYMVTHPGLRSFDGEFEFYCDFYDAEGDLVGSHLIQRVEPTENRRMISVGGEFSISELELEDDPATAVLRVYVDGKQEISFENFRLSPKNPLISTITDTLGRTIEFTYGADLYEIHDEDDYVDYDILVEILDPNGNEIRKIWYERNKYTYDNDIDGDMISSNEYYLFWGAYNGEYWENVDYTWEEGSQSNVRWQWTDTYTTDYYGRPFVSCVHNRNSKTYYEYEPVHKWLASSWKQKSCSSTNTGFIITYRVIKRYDVNNVVDSTKGENSPYNIITYNYTTGLYDDETAYNTRTNRRMYPGYLKPDDGSYKVVVTHSTGSIETYEYTSHIFDEGAHRVYEVELPLLDKHTLQEDSSSTSDCIVTEYTYEHDFAVTSPTKVKVTETVDSESRTYYTINEYDDDSCLQTMTTLPLTESEISSIPEYKKVNTEYQEISDGYFVPTVSKYYQSADGTQLTQSTEYDDMGRIISQTDEAGNTVYTEYNETHPWLVSKVWYADPENIGDEERISEIQYLYEDNYLLGPTTTRTKYAEDKYAETSATYDPKYGGLLSTTDEKENVTTYTYDSLGRLDEIRYPSYQRDQELRYVVEEYYYIKNMDYNNTYYFYMSKYVWDNKSINSWDSIEDGEDIWCDDYGNAVCRRVEEGLEEYIYDTSNRVIAYRDYNDYGTDNISASCTYDNLNRIVSSTDKLGNTAYADYKLLRNEYYFTPAGTTVQENHTAEYYDMYGNMIKSEVYPAGKTSAPITASFTYDLAGNVITSTDGNGNTTSFEYDAIGNNIKTVRADGSVVENEFTKWGTPTKTTVIDGNNRYSANNNYDDDRGLVTSTYSTGLDINTRPWYNEYDVDGSLLKTTDPNSNINSMEYDCSGNLIKSENGSEIINYAYQFDGQLLGREKYRNNTYVEDVKYSYNYLKQLSSKTIGSDITLYTYNVMGSITIITYPVDFATVYDYDEAERMTGVEFDGKNISYEYYGDSAIKKITYPNSMTTEYSYDNANRVTSIVTKLNGNVLRSYSYTYDGNGNVLTVGGSENAAYTYDSLNRLASSTKNGVTTTYSYDVRNNLISETDGTNTKTYEYGGDNRLHKVVENGIETIYEYDLNGNLVQRGEDTFAYDENNRLVYSNVDGVEATYIIGAEDLRRSKVVGDTATNYSYNENGYVFVENDEPIVYGHTALAKKSGTSYYYYLYNAHGDVTAIVDETGNILNSYEYTPWGEISAQTETVENDIKYAGEYYDEETGLIYLRNRYYDPSVRRFTSEDPARDDLNWYCYCGNNPVNFVDPWGLENIVVAGGAYHPNNGNKYQYTFVDTALKAIADLKGNATLLVANAGWDSEQRALIESVAAEKGISLFWFSSVDSLTNYINSGRDRTIDPITSFYVFAHGTDSDTGKYAITFGLHSDNDFRWYTGDISRINKNSFSKDAYSKFFSCRTGNTFDNGNFAESWAKQTGSTTYAFAGTNGKTNYADINGNDFESVFPFIFVEWDKWNKKRGPVEKKPGEAYHYPKASENSYMKVFTQKGSVRLDFSW